MKRLSIILILIFVLTLLSFVLEWRSWYSGFNSLTDAFKYNGYIK